MTASLMRPTGDQLLAMLAALANPLRLRIIAAEYLWGWGVQPLPGLLLRRDWARLACTAARLAGYVVGFARASSVRVIDGHFASSSS